MSADRIAQAAVARLDEIAHAMERKWGVDRLAKLVDPALAARFRTQADKLDEALRSGRHEAIATQALAMERAWAALDKAASSSNAQPLNPAVWETVIPSTGEVIAIVRTPEEAWAVARDHGGAVYTLAEIAMAIEAFGDAVRATKATFPGASVTAVRSRSLNIGAAATERTETARRRSGRKPRPDPFAPIRGIPATCDDDLNDEIPF